jgi:hypothetical protein
VASALVPAAQIWPTASDYIARSTHRALGDHRLVRRDRRRDRRVGEQRIFGLDVDR